MVLTTSYYETVFKTTVLESMDTDSGNVSLEGVKVYADNEFVGTTDENVEVKCLLKEGEYDILLDNGTFNRTQKINVNDDIEFNTPMMALDLNKDGCVNAKDYMMINAVDNIQAALLYNQIFMNFYNINENTFNYLH